MAWNDSRPLSPHLQIYKLPLTALVSITHRITGAALSIGVLGLVWVLWRAAAGEAAFATAAAVLGSGFGKFVLFGFTFALYLHLCNGLRHLFWDVGMGYELETVDKPAKLTVVAAAVLTIVTWVVA